MTLGDPESESQKSAPNMAAPTTAYTPILDSVIDSIGIEGEERTTPEESIQPVGKGHITGSVINLTNTIIGAGVLGLPYAYAGAGYVLGTILLLCFAFFSSMGLHLLQVSAREVSPGHGSFFAVANASVPTLAFLSDAAVAIKCFGVACAYLLVIGDLVPSALSDLSCIKDGSCAYLSDREFWIGLSLIFVVPLSYLKNLDSLKFTSGLCMLFVFYITVVIVLQEVIPNLDPCAGMAGELCPGERVAFNFDMRTVKSLSIFIFAFTCHQNIFAIANELNNSTEDRVDRVIAWSICNASVIYLIVATFGYMAFGSLVSSNILVPILLCDNDVVLIIV